MRGAVMVLASLRDLCSSVQSRPLPLPGSLIAVIPCAIHSLKTYSAGVERIDPPM